MSDKTKDETLYYLQDDLGNPVCLVNEHGMRREVLGYDEFGASLHPSFRDQPFTFTGYPLDPVADTLYAQVRQYDPRTGRFTSEDIVKGFIHAPFTLNHYTYCWNRPLKFIDLDGRIPTPQEAAIMAEHIYGKDKDNPRVEGAWVGDWELIEIKTNTNNWFTKYLTTNGMLMGVYQKTHNDGTVEYALVNKGTNSLGNWANNVHQVTGSSQDMKDSIKAASQFVDAHAGYEVTMVGHSKGGAEARRLVHQTHR